MRNLDPDKIDSGITSYVTRAIPDVLLLTRKFQDAYLRAFLLPKITQGNLGTGEFWDSVDELGGYTDPGIDKSEDAPNSFMFFLNLSRAVVRFTTPSWYRIIAYSMIRKDLGLFNLIFQKVFGINASLRDGDTMTGNGSLLATVPGSTDQWEVVTPTGVMNPVLYPESEWTGHPGDPYHDLPPEWWVPLQLGSDRSINDPRWSIYASEKAADSTDYPIPDSLAWSIVSGFPWLTDVGFFTDTGTSSSALMDWDARPGVRQVLVADLNVKVDSIFDIDRCRDPGGWAASHSEPRQHGASTGGFLMDNFLSRAEDLADFLPIVKPVRLPFGYDVSYTFVHNRSTTLSYFCQDPSGSVFGVPLFYNDSFQYSVGDSVYLESSNEVYRCNRSLGPLEPGRSHYLLTDVADDGVPCWSNISAMVVHESPFMEPARAELVSQMSGDELRASYGLRSSGGIALSAVGFMGDESIYVDQSYADSGILIYNIVSLSHPIFGVTIGYSSFKLDYVGYEFSPSYPIPSSALRPSRMQVANGVYDAGWCKSSPSYVLTDDEVSDTWRAYIASSADLASGVPEYGVCIKTQGWHDSQIPGFSGVDAMGTYIHVGEGKWKHTGFDDGRRADDSLYEALKHGSFQFFFNWDLIPRYMCPPRFSVNLVLDFKNILYQ